MLGDVVVVLAVAFALAFLAEGMTEYFLGTLMDKVGRLSGWRWALMYVSALVGVGLCLYWQVDLIAVIANTVGGMVGQAESWNVSPVGVVLSGLVVGRGSNYLHDFLKKYLVKPEVSG